MMTEAPYVLYASAVTIGFLHTLLGPDHYLPFVAMSRAGGWSLRRTLVVTLLCGVGHVMGSVAVGLVGLAVGVTLFKLERLESARGEIAGWLLLAFGLVYFVWGIRRAIRNQPHTHCHVHADGTIHAHQHVHAADHVHIHPKTRPRALTTDPSAAGDGTLTPWILFTIFVFGPCEPLIPLLLYPAAQGSTRTVVWVTILFGITTLATMVAVVMLASMAVGKLPLVRAARFGHALAGFVVLACGAAVTVGW